MTTEVRATEVLGALGIIEKLIHHSSIANTADRRIAGSNIRRGYVGW
jgi:hypothetical protein